MDQRYAKYCFVSIQIWTQVLIPNFQVIIWDDGLSGPFGLIAEYSLLKKRDAVKMHPLRPGKIKTIETENVIFICRPHLKLMGYIVENILKWAVFFNYKNWRLIYWYVLLVLLQWRKLSQKKVAFVLRSYEKFIMRRTSKGETYIVKAVLFLIFTLVIRFML